MRRKLLNLAFKGQPWDKNISGTELRFRMQKPHSVAGQAGR